MLSKGEFNELGELIYARCGISTPPNRYEKLKTKIERLIEKSGFSNYRTFYRDLRFNAESKNFQKLINIVTINETYFYREKHQFDTLIGNVFPQILDEKGDSEPLRVLCAPSSTGEEPYSIVLHLLEENSLLHRADFEIVGIDIDNRVIEEAKQGVYGKRSVQNLPKKLLRSFFKECALNRYELHNEVKDSVTFKVVNIMDREQMRRLRSFDVIFSRNMLIYFDELSRREVVRNFHDILKPHGYVFLGHAESMGRASSSFNSVKVGQNVVYTKERQRSQDEYRRGSAVYTRPYLR